MTPKFFKDLAEELCRVAEASPSLYVDKSLRATAGAIQKVVDRHSLDDLSWREIDRDGNPKK